MLTADPYHSPYDKFYVLLGWRRSFRAFGRQAHTLTIPRSLKNSCPTNTFSMMMYRWTVPLEFATNSRCRLCPSRNDLIMLQSSGEATVRGKQASKSYSTSSLRCGTTTFAISYIFTLKILLVVGWMIST